MSVHGCDLVLCCFVFVATVAALVAATVAVLAYLWPLDSVVVLKSTMVGLHPNLVVVGALAFEKSDKVDRFFSHPTPCSPVAFAYVALSVLLCVSVADVLLRLVAAAFACCNRTVC